ncbi:YqgQ family protein [Priestia megaterium]|uniref:YqgQ family protein n=1 Tax=Priestia megaterium TaxID=1404 RepID=UPI002A6A61FF|nr:YqgQ family protein [Priestia megaterium]MDY0939164.1 YqgQ family protein [Priestia megaterium]
MNTLYDVQKLLKSFGIFIYVGDRTADLELMEAEVKELYQSNLIDVRDYQMAILLLRRELKQQKEKKDE